MPGASGIIPGADRDFMNTNDPDKAPGPSGLPAPGSPGKTIDSGVIGGTILTSRENQTMNRTLSAACLIIATLAVTAASGPASSPGTRGPYAIGDTVTLTGTIISSTYLSRSDGSDREYFNDAFLLRLEKSIDITDGREPGRRYRGISHIEIEDPNGHEAHRFTGAKVRIRGILKTFSGQPGYHRQYATPIKIEILDI